MSGGVLFFRQFLTRFGTTGAVAPSWHMLARQLARDVGANRGGEPIKVFEAGPGTGSVTREILKKLDDGDRLVAYEVNSRFVDYLQEKIDRDPHINASRVSVSLVEGRAQDCDESSFDHAVCSIPFTNFLPQEVQIILESMMKNLKPGGTLSYFDYWGMGRLRGIMGGRAERARMQAVDAVRNGFLEQYGTGQKLILLNLPPAIVRHCRKP
ncbi:class I SAM-dependent methyltransferase [Candidatus Neomarinimicrobiota bacterium]